MESEPNTYRLLPAYREPMKSSRVYTK